MKREILESFLVILTLCKMSERNVNIVTFIIKTFSSVKDQL